MVGGAVAAGRERITEILQQTVDVLQQVLVQLKESQNAIDGHSPEIEANKAIPSAIGIAALAHEARQLSQELLKGLSMHRSNL